MRNALHIGEDGFRAVREANAFYVDKTGFLEEFIRTRPQKASLFTRPRGFGKSLMLSMMSEFFDCLKDSKEIFAGLQISQNEDLCKKWMNRCPVIYINFKTVAGKTFEEAYASLKAVLSDEFVRHAYLLDNSEIPKNFISDIASVINNKAEDQQIFKSVYKLTCCLKIHYEVKPIVLIDEYDVPLAMAQKFKYYEKKSSKQ